MNISICEDEDIHAERLRDLILKNADALGIEPIIKIFKTGGRLLESMGNQKYGVIFLDIRIKNENGLDIAKQIRLLDKSVPIVFVTGFIDYVQQGYEARAFRYVLKSQLEGQIFKIMTDVIKETEKEYFKFKLNHDTLIIKKDKICYFESERRLLHIVCQDCKYSFYGKINDIECEFPHFIRCHKSFLVSPAFVKCYSSAGITINDDVTIPISRGYAKSALSKLETWR